jgi:hypothetical protein
MPDTTFPLTLVTLTLDNGLFLGEVMFFPEVSRLASTRERLYKRLLRNVTNMIRHLAPAELHRRRMARPEGVVTQYVTVEVEPPPHAQGWRRPVALRLPAVRWRHGTDAHLIRVFGLGIEVAAEREDDLDAALPEEARAALLRAPDPPTLRRLACSSG